MHIEIEFDSNETLDIQYEDIINTVVEGVLRFENCPYEANVNVLITDDEEIQKLNNEYRNIDNTTDVLSFPMIDFKSPADFDFLDGIDYYFDQDNGDLILGDIALSVKKIKSQAALYGHSIKRELGFLVAHSVLHLIGYDHINDDERLVMEEKQKLYLDKLNIKREN